MDSLLPLDEPATSVLSPNFGHQSTHDVTVSSGLSKVRLIVALKAGARPFESLVWIVCDESATLLAEETF